MNILVLSHLYPRPHDPSYGIFVHRQVKHLQKLGLHITVLSSVPWSPRVLHFNVIWRNYGLVPDRSMWEDTPVYYPRYVRLPGAWFRIFSGFTAYKGMLPLALELHNEHKYDVIHSNTLLPDGLAGLYLGQKLNLPTVCTVHGSDVLIHPKENLLNLHASRIVIQRTQQVVAVSRALKYATERLTVPSRAVHRVYNGVTTEEFHESGEKLPGQDQNQMASIKPFVLFVGRDIHKKGLRDLLTAFAQLVDSVEHNLVVIGPSFREVKRLDSELTELLGNRLIVPGCLPPDEIPPYMQNCELFVLPSYSEALGIVVLEAMACKRPVIATNVGGIPEMVIDGVTGLLVPPYEPSALVKAIQSLIDDPARAREMGGRGRERVAKEFTWERNALEMMSIYREVIGASSVS